MAHSFCGFYASEFAQRNKGKIIGAVFIDVAIPCNFTTEYSERLSNSISGENWKLLQQYKVGLYYVLKKIPDITDYMSGRYIPNSIPLTLVATEIREPTKEIGETEQDMLNWANCLNDFGNLPNHSYVLAPNAGHKVWENKPELVIEQITKLYKRTIKESNR